MAFLMLDHPGWTVTSDGTHRVMRDNGTVWHLSWHADGAALAPAVVEQAGPVSAPPTVDQVAARPTESPIPALGPALVGLGPVLRVRNTDLWDAIGTAIIRQVIRAPQARQMYARFCQAHGQQITVNDGAYHLFPTPQTVLDLPTSAFSQLGMAFKRPALVAAADAYLTHASSWAALDPPALVTALQTVPRIGPWTAGAAVADATGDFACYPYADLAIRTWARRAAPEHQWPDQEPAFGALWKRTAGASLSAMTLLTLAWGDAHVRAPQRRTPDPAVRR